MFVHRVQKKKKKCKKLTYLTEIKQILYLQDLTDGDIYLFILIILIGSQVWHMRPCTTPLSHEV